MKAFLAIFAALSVLTACGGSNPENHTSPYGSGDGGSTFNPGGGDTPGGIETPEEQAYRLWNDGGGIQPAPKGVPAGYEPKTYSNPLWTSMMLPDPTVIRVKGVYYLFATGGNVRLLKSTDLVHWEKLSNEAFTDAGRPKWLTKPDGSKAGLWAPDVNYINGKYVLFYSLAGRDDTKQEGYNGIGRAISDNVTGPYTDLGKLIDPNTYGTDHVIDPFYFEYNGKKYLQWGSFWKIHRAELTDDGLYLKTEGDGTTKSIVHVANDKIEGSLIHKHGDYYYLIGSNGSTLKGYESTYHLVAARAATPLGPFLTEKGEKVTTAGVVGLTFLEGAEPFIGPGHNAEIVTDEAGDDWILYHAYKRGFPTKTASSALTKSPGLRTAGPRSAPPPPPPPLPSTINPHPSIG